MKFKVVYAHEGAGFHDERTIVVEAESEQNIKDNFKNSNPSPGDYISSITKVDECESK